MNYIKLCLLLLFTSFSKLDAQQIPLNKYGLSVITSVKDYKRSVAGKDHKTMTDIRKYLPGISIDLRYADSGNFMKHPLYPALKTTYIRRSVAERLIKIESALNLSGLGLKIWDAYRPYHVTEKMWELVRDDRYAADPRKGSGHNRGVAIDVTLINKINGKELDMGTSFDHFSDTAHHDFSGLNESTRANRKLLREIMIKNGFKALESEWWHYFLPDHLDYELLDLSFSEVRRISSK